MMDPAVVDTVFADVLAHLFGPSSPQSNLPTGVTAACSGRSNLLPNVTAAGSGQSNSSPGITTTCSGPSHSNKFKFPFTSLLTLLQGPT